MSEERWFQVVGSFEVKAANQDAAIALISDAVTEANVPGLFPVGTFDAQPVDDPITRARRRLQIRVGDRAEHWNSGWAGEVTAIEGSLVTVRPDHPRPKDAPEGWTGWKPITVEADELRRV